MSRDHFFEFLSETDALLKNYYQLIKKNVTITARKNGPEHEKYIVYFPG